MPTHTGRPKEAINSRKSESQYGDNSNQIAPSSRLKQELAPCPTGTAALETDRAVVRDLSLPSAAHSEVSGIAGSSRKAGDTRHVTSSPNNSSAADRSQR
jgi:hypothetical protein